jgi:light-regulated signal transduction histidine kinase (bacteriophytochrome)
MTLTVFRRFEHFPLTFRASTPMSGIWRAWLAIVMPLYGVITVFVLALVGLNVWLARLRRRIAQERDAHIAELQAANRDLVRANQELDAFSYTVAHDLRAPVRALDGFAGILAEEHGDDLGQDGRGVLARIRAATSRMESLIDGLLSFARLSREEPKLREVDMRSMAEGVAAELRPADARHLLTVDDLPPCNADPALMRQVWTNLLSNALKYSRNQAQPRIEVGFSDGAYFVRDNGAGFDMAHSGNLFGVFSRLHRHDDFEGTGVGLAITRRIIERHGGRIWAQAAPGEGATFHFTVGTASAADAPPA